MELNKTKIAIVGGGPGGLTLARLLQLKGAHVKVYERDFSQEARLIGSPLDMHEGSGLAALRSADLLGEFKKSFRPGADRMLIMNEDAQVFFSDHDSKQKKDFGNEGFRPEIDRGPLRKLLLESLQPETVVWDSHFISMKPQGEGWLMQFKNESAVYADIVIAADGANSKLRPYITQIKPFYTGVTMLEGNLYNLKTAAPNFDKLIKGGKIMAFGKNKNLLLGQKGSGDLGFYVSFKTEEAWAKESGLDYADKTQVLQWFNREYAEWNPIWNELFENAHTPFIPRPIYCTPIEQTWEALPNATMIGDAAHVMPPFAGEGANMAMLDALELSQCLTSDLCNTVQEAISSFEMAMRKRAAIATKDSLENGEQMHSIDALNIMLDFFQRQ